LHAVLAAPRQVGNGLPRPLTQIQTARCELSQRKASALDSAEAERIEPASTSSRRGRMPICNVLPGWEFIMLGSSLRLFNVAGTDVRVHPTFFFLLAWIGAVYWMRGGPSAAVHGVILISLLFVCVVLHEFGHIFAARRYGIRTPDVTLLPIGGVASLERIPEKPSQEIFVALAGPAVNVVIALVLSLILGARIDVAELAELQQARSGVDALLVQLASANVALVIFNLIPAFPMDGGRVLRALLSIPFGHTQATRVAAGIGQAFAVVLGFLGLLAGNAILVLVAVFVFLAAAGESGYVQARDIARGRLAAQAMITRFEPLGVHATVDDAAALLLRTTQHEFPVVDGARQLRGVVTRDAILGALQAGNGAASVLDVMTRDVPTVGETACLDMVFSDLMRSATRFVGVVDRDKRLVGYLTPENISELVMIQSYRAARRETGASGVGSRVS
jgi:Zn-dependent protease/CBS domain-containing protein